jgi:hypothetical protein
MSELTFKQPEPGKKLSKAEAQKKVETQKERDLEMVTGIFEYKNKRGQTLKFRFGKYEEDGFKEYILTDGKRYRLPRMVVRHLNKNCFYTEYKRLDGLKGVTDMPIQADIGGTQDTYAKMYAVSKDHRCEFKSLEFMDDDLNANNEVIEVAYR